MVISTGTTVPIMDAVRALYSLQKAIIFRPCWPKAGPTGGAGLALPAWICSLTTAFTFLAILTNPPPQIITAHNLRAKSGDVTPAQPAKSLLLPASRGQTC